MATPLNKEEFYREYAKGAFGNRPRTWDSWSSLQSSGYRGSVTVRSMVAGAPCHYGVPVADLEQGRLSVEDVRFNESMPDEYLTLQGNVWHDGFTQLEYSCQPGIGHRQAVQQPFMRSASGLMAVSLLKTFFDPSSYDDLQELLDNYVGAVIEFSAYSKNVGVIPGRNVVFWEVRGY